MTLSNQGISVDSLCKSYSQVVVVDNVSFKCEPGTITGLLGPNGSGKSTTMRMMIGLTQPDSGSATFDGISYTNLDSPGRLVGSLLDPSAHHPGRSVREILKHAAMMLDMSGNKADLVAERFGLGAVKGRLFGALSLGMKQRVALAIALLGEPRHLILDEPVNGLDVESSHWLRDTLFHYTRERGTSVLISTHLLQELQSFADNVVVMSKGKVIHSGTIKSIGAFTGTLVRCENNNELAKILDDKSVAYTLYSDHIIVNESARMISEICLINNILLDELTAVRENLEDAYLRMTSSEFSIGDGR